MPEMWECAADSDREIRGESGVAVLGVFGVSEVSDDAESLKRWCKRKGLVMETTPFSSRLNFDYLIYSQLAIDTADECDTHHSPH